MVRIENVSEAVHKRNEKHNLIKKLAVELFGEKRVHDSSTRNELYITPSSEIRGLVASINHVTNTISVFREEEYQQCLLLAEKWEKEIEQEVTLRTTYRTENKNDC